MRKFTLFLILLLGIGFIACENSDTELVDPTYPSPMALVVDDEASGANSIALLFDGRAATMEEVFTVHKHGIKGKISVKDAEALAEYVNSL